MLARRATIRKPIRRGGKRAGGSLPPKSLTTVGNGSTKLTTFAVHRATTPTAPRVSFKTQTGTCLIGNSSGAVSPGVTPTLPGNPGGLDSEIAKCSLQNSNCNDRSTCVATSPASLNPQRPSLYEAVAILKAQEDEKSLCQSDWSADASLDQPSYGSIVHQLKEANIESESSCDFLRKFIDIVQNTILVTVVLGLFTALPVAMVTVGVKYMHECPLEPKVPIYLLVGGCFGLLKLLSLVWKQVRLRRYERLDDIYVDEDDDGHGDILMSKSSRFSEAILSIFLFIWFVCGNYWVLRIWKPNFKQLLHEPSNWCDQTVYMFAFGQIMGCYALMGLIIFLTSCLLFCHKCTTIAYDKS